MCLMFAATYPARASALVLFGTFASMKSEPWMMTREALDEFLARLIAHWGEGILVRLNAPSRRDDPVFLQWFARIERAAASPGSVRALMEANYEIDVRHLLPTIQAPTLILHRAGDKLVPVNMGRYLAEHIPGAKHVEIPGTDHLVLATIMFTDIVRSTERAVELGDARWNEVLGNYYAVLRKQLTAFRGHFGTVLSRIDILRAAIPGHSYSKCRGPGPAVKACCDYQAG
jgi:hypothetical protein